MKYADYLDPSNEIIPGNIYTTEYWTVNNTIQSVMSFFFFNYILF